MRLPLVAMLSMTGCGFGSDEKIMSLAELKSPSLAISIGDPEPYLAVELSYDWYDLEQCAVLGTDFTARVADVDIPITGRGGVNPYTDGGLECASFSMSLWVRPESTDAILELGDPSRTIRCDLGDALVVSPRPRAFECGGVENHVVGP